MKSGYWIETVYWDERVPAGVDCPAFASISQEVFGRAAERMAHELTRFEIGGEWFLMRLETKTLMDASDGGCIKL